MRNVRESRVKVDLRDIIITAHNSFPRPKLLQDTSFVASVLRKRIKRKQNKILEKQRYIPKDLFPVRKQSAKIFHRSEEKQFVGKTVALRRHQQATRTNTFVETSCQMTWRSRQTCVVFVVSVRGVGQLFETTRARGSRLNYKQHSQ